MSAGGQGLPEIRKLWPTLMLRHRLPGADKADPILPEHRILPRAGDILLWPAFLHHLVHPNLSDELRVSVSFNIVLRWRDSYLP